MSRFTPHQEEAIRSRGNVLVMAGAGTGKTHTLVERCLSLLLDPAANTGLDRILMVTFTEAAAAEMRHRIRQSLEKNLQSQRDAEIPDTAVIQRLEEQLALLDTARIGTLHGFCLRLIREHFAELDIDPQLNVLDPGAARLMLEETLDGILDRHYRSSSETSEQLRAFIRLYGRGQDGRVREQVRKLHAYSQTLPSPARWLEEQEAQFYQPEPRHWYPMWRDSVLNLRHWQPLVDSISGEHSGASGVAARLRELAQAPDDRLSAALAALHASFEWPKAKKGEGDLNKRVRKALDGLIKEAGMLHGFAPGPEHDPLAQDWEWVRHGLRAIITVTREFSEAFRNAKRELAAVDFQDIEQLTLSLLWNEDRTVPGPVAEACRELFDFVFVDEYQDINPAQDLILMALSRDGERANRFLVGDVKQSIYRFRLANPAIFQNYARQWKAGEDNGRAIALGDNFRSREAILDFVNGAFTTLMRKDIGGVEYDEHAALRFGNAEGRKPLAKGSPRVELQLFLTGLDPSPVDEDGEGTASTGGIEELSSAERESRWIAARLAALRQSGHEVWDHKKGVFRPADWGDMVILLRSPSSKAEVYAKEFSRRGIPFQAPRGGFYSSIEIADLLALLQILDNPLQDIPLLAVLRSPFVGLSLTELATARQTVPKGQFWFALNRSSAGNP
ncbi:MAG TPA: UvrD-helicase domain-containing protein, partial [Roseimicrobium sp.]|nr:UvrD-helicase domain-containing protein [Roseimicrobium sp.]